MATKQPLLTLYANLMDEVKLRIACVDKAVHGRIHMQAPIVREFCYLQLRLLCELIALSCLVAHGDIAATYSKRLSKQWSADKIMDELERLHPDFYPQAVRQTPQVVNAQKGWNLEGIQPSPLPKAGLLKLYGQCHQRLHRGNVNKLLSSELPIDINPNFPEIIGWAQKLNDLLQSHLVVLKPQGPIYRGLVCNLRNADDNNRVQVAIIDNRAAQLQYS
jgi:hypothetical protein